MLNLSMIKIRLLCAGFALTLLLSVFSAVFHPNKAYALTANVVDRSTIKIGDKVFFDGDIDNNFNYQEQSPSDNCEPDTINGFNNSSDFRPGKTPDNATLTTTTPAGAGSKACTKSTQTIDFGSTRNNFLKAFRWVDSNTIGASDGKLTFKRHTGSTVFESTTNHNDCSDTLTIDSSNQTATLVARVGTLNSSTRPSIATVGPDDYDWYPFERPSNHYQDWKWNSGLKCWESPAVTAVQLSGTPSKGSTGGAGGSGDSGTAQKDSCESINTGLSWIICPVINILDGVTSSLDTVIQSLLETPDPNTLGGKKCINPQDPNDKACHLYQAWGRVRNVALIILIPIMLVMVIGTALGFSFLDAYTVKRAMPRFLIAILFISLSWYITAFLISLTNVVGHGILGLITQPFGVADQTLKDLINPGAAGVSTVATGAIIFGLFFTHTISLGIIFSLAFVAAIGLLIGFLVLVVRQILLIALVILAPLAILAWIFPNNDRMWKLWWGTFSKLLLMYPLIMILIGAGRIAASIIPFQQGNTSGLLDGLFTNILIVIAYVLPYFFIPLTFRFAGGILGNLSGWVNDKSRGLFDRQKKYRAETAAKGHERFGRRVVARKADWQGRLQDAASRRGRVGGAALRTLGYGLGYNVQADSSARQLSVAKEINDQINTGRDEEIRGLTVNRRAARAAGALVLDADGHMSNGLMRTNGDTGATEYKTLGGAWVSEANVLGGYRRWGNDRYAQQAALSYEMRKAMTDDEVQGISERYETLSTDRAGGWGMNGGQATGALKGAGFENQNQHLEFKYTKLDGTVDYKGMAKEAYEKRGSYPLAQMSSHTIARLKEAYDTGDAETQQYVQGVAENFMYRGGVSAGAAGSDDEAARAAAAAAARAAGGAPGATVPGEFFQTNTPGPAHVAESVRDLAVHTGVYQPDLGSARTRSDRGPGDTDAAGRPLGPPGGPHTPPPDIPRQN